MVKKDEVTEQDVNVNFDDDVSLSPEEAQAKIIFELCS